MKKWISCLMALLILTSLAGCGEEQTTATVPELLEPVGVKMDTAVVEYGNIYNVSYMEGQVIPGTCKGWCLITVGGYSLGWGKGDGTSIKNHYPKGLRRNS